MKFLSKKISYIKNKKFDIIIYDECNYHILKKIIPSKYSIFILEKRSSNFYFNFLIFYLFFKNLIHIKIYFSNIYYTLKQIKYAYEKSIIDYINPLAVLSYIDNSQSYSWIAQNTKHSKFISIQNGLRLSYEAINNQNYFAQHLFCYGKFEEKLFSRLKYKVNNFYPVGSLAASLYKSSEFTKVKYDILIVSCWRGNIGFSKDVHDTMKAMKIMDQYLSNFLLKNKCKFAIITRSEKDSADWYMNEIGMTEEEYFRSIYGNDALIINTDFKKRNIYSLMFSSNLIVTSLSTAALEAFGFGKKILYCNFHYNNKYHRDFHNSILYTGHSQNEKHFFKRLSNLMSIPYATYLGKQKKIMNYYMTYPKQELSYHYIKRKISELINNS
jgi:surface carbohydrate biosynthesis protein